MEEFKKKTFMFTALTFWTPVNNNLLLLYIFTCLLKVPYHPIFY